VDTYETTKALEGIKELFPRFSLSNSSVSAWHRLICQYCTAEEFKAALDKQLVSSDSIPGMFSMRGHIAAVKAEGKAKTGKLAEYVDRSEYRAPSDMEFCLNNLGAAYVNRQLTSIIKGPQTGQAAIKTVLALCRQKNWVPAYKKLMERLVAEAMQVANGERHVSEIVR